VVEVASPRDGHVAALDAYHIGETIVRLGGGRLRKEDGVDPAVGVVLLKKTGDRVAAGEALALVHARDAAEDARAAVLAAYRIADAPGAPGRWCASASRPPEPRRAPAGAGGRRPVVARIRIH